MPGPTLPADGPRVNTDEEDAMAQGDQQERARKWGQIVARAWREPAYKQRLMADPAAVLREEGLAVPAGQQVRLVENTDQVLHLVLPQKPRDLSDEQLDHVAGGGQDASGPNSI